MTVTKLCECGCGQPVTKAGNRFIVGHNTKTEYYRNKQKLKMTGNKYGKGQIFT